MKRMSLLIALLITACSNESGPPLTVSQVEVTRPMPGMSMSAGYFVLRNDSRVPTRITSVSSPQFGSVEMHETTLENNVSRMREIPEVIVPPGDEVIFERGGKHLMLMQADDDLSNVTLNFYSDDALLLSVSVTED